MLLPHLAWSLVACASAQWDRFDYSLLFSFFTTSGHFCVFPWNQKRQRGYHPACISYPVWEYQGTFLGVSAPSASQPPFLATVFCILRHSILFFGIVAIYFFGFSLSFIVYDRRGSLWVILLFLYLNVCLEPFICVMIPAVAFFTNKKAQCLGVFN